MALIRPGAKDGHPDNQIPGTYIETPPAVQAYRRGEPLDDADRAAVNAYCMMNNVPCPDWGAYERRMVGKQEAEAQAARTEKPNVFDSLRRGRKLVRSEPHVTTEETPLMTMFRTMVDLASEADKEEMLASLAGELGYAMS